MKLKKVTVINLNKKVSIHDYQFHDDINMITGMNGSGKTTFLKMVWYAISGNIERIISEISFDEFYIETSDYSINIKKNDSNINWDYKNLIDGKDSSGEFNITDPESRKLNEELDKLNHLVIQNSKSSSLYFPTFRRIEGDYSMGNTTKVRRILSSGQVVYETIERNRLQDSFDMMSSQLSVYEHKFICSMSTNDIVSLLTERYTKA